MKKVFLTNVFIIFTILFYIYCGAREKISTEKSATNSESTSDISSKSSKNDSSDEFKTVIPHSVEQKAIDAFKKFFIDNKLNEPNVSFSENSSGLRIVEFGVMGSANPDEMAAFISLSFYYFDCFIKASKEEGYKEYPKKYSFVLHGIFDFEKKKAILCFSNLTPYSEFCQKYRKKETNKKVLQNEFFEKFPYRYYDIKK